MGLRVFVRELGQAKRQFGVDLEVLILRGPGYVRVEEAFEVFH